VQTEDYALPQELFHDDYAYFSSYSKSWLEHAKRFANTVIDRFGLGKESCVAEIAANDGYLLQYFKSAGVPCYGIEPTAGTAQAAKDKGLEIVTDFFGKRLAEELSSKDRRADLLIANNVFAHVPDLSDFISGIPVILKPQGIVTIEFAHILTLVKHNHFDSIYHEHYSYWSLLAAEATLARHGLVVFDVEILPTHGGSLRLFVQSKDSGAHAPQPGAEHVREIERSVRLDQLETYAGLQGRAEEAKQDLLRFLSDFKRGGKAMAAYGAAAKGNTLLNYSGVTPDLIPWVVDANPAKIGKYLPGSRIPIVSEDMIKKRKPDAILILPWNLKDEIMRQLSYIQEWNGRFVTAIPSVQCFAADGSPISP